MGSKRGSKDREEDMFTTNISTSLERLKKARALHCEPEYIGIDTLILRMIPFTRPGSLY
jgi:hypothetical protein